MNHHTDHNHEGLWHIIKGFALSIVVYIVQLFEGWVKHNGGYEEMFYSLVTIAVYGFFGAAVSYFGTKFWKWVSK